MTMMNGKMDRMENLPAFQQGALDLLEQVLETADRPVEIVAFGCARIVAVDYNRYPELMLEKVRKVHLCAGTATSDYRMGSDAGAMPSLEGSGMSLWIQMLLLGCWSLNYRSLFIRVQE